MAIALGNTQAFVASGTTTSSHTISFDSGTGSDRVLIVPVYTVDLNITTTVTYNGVAMTKVATVPRGDNPRNINLFYLANPATGGNNIVASFSPNSRSAIGAAIYTGVDTTDILDDADWNSTTGPVTSLTATLTASLDGAVGIGCGWCPGGVSSTNATQLHRYDNFEFFRSTDVPIASAGSYDMVLTVGSSYGSIIGMIINPAGGAGPAFTPRVMVF